MHNFKELKVWQKSRVLTSEIYNITRKLPKDERFGLISQMDRAVVSIPSNIAEGSGRFTNRDFRRFLDYSLGSAYELETQIILSYDLGFVSEKDYLEILKKIEEVQKMIFGFRKTLSIKSKVSSFLISLFL
ncbi:MAG: diversity-generating retroelement protein bAvd family protein [Bacteroidetes bacterium]|nr:MAG: diversity-generating retroelement protein bAvd family protein [Bacteroidota bacterium]